MIRDICSLNIKGRYFSKGINLPLFPDKQSRFVLVYGRNGSGKSTISEGISEALKNQDLTTDIIVEAVDEHDNTINDWINDNIFVFNEKYIENNIKFAEEGLQTILLLGKQIDLKAEIDECEKNLNEFKNNYEQNNEEFQKYEDKNSPTCPDKYKNNIVKILQSDSGWAQTDSNIKGNTVKSKVNDSLINEIGELQVAETKETLQKAFDEQKVVYDKIGVDASPCNIEIHMIEFDKNTEQSILSTLAARIEKPELSDREKIILETIGKINFIDSARNTFSKEDVHVCPYCFQSVNDDYKQKLINEINNVLNKNVEDHRSQLLNCIAILPTFEFDYEAYKSIDSGIANNIYVQASECKKISDSYIRALDRKNKNCYEPVILDNANLYNEITRLNSLLMALEQKRIEFNNAIKTRNQLKNTLLSINKKIAHINIKTEYDNYITFCAQKESLKIKCSEAKKKVDWAQMKLKTLQEQSSDAGLAIEKINNALNYIFFTSGRFSVELKENKYYLKSNGENVLPKNISVGERNIIALCYFFTQIMSNKDTNAFYKDENLIIIDDPVSSFDFENKVGIISYLRYQIASIILGNKNSRVVVFSHDLETIYHLEKVGSEICNKSNSNSNVKKFKLENKVLIPCPKGISGEYESLLRKIFNFATNEDNESLEIGNIIRRVLEAFSSFVYKEGIEKISLNTDVLSVLENHSKFFENLMYRLVLHGESHYEEQIKSMHDNFNFYKFVSEDEKRDIAKHILCFLYLLNKAHLKAYLIDKKVGDIQNVEDTIKQWLKDIPTNDKFES